MPQTVSFNLLEFVEKWRQDNGFYSSNYQRYCKLCTSRLSTLRKDLHFNDIFKINAKSKEISKPIYVHTSDLQRQQMEHLLTNLKLYEYITVQSERCISRGFQLRDYMQGSNQKSKRSIYRSLRTVQKNEKQRLTKGEERSNTLLTLAEKSGDVSSRISARAYQFYLKGLVAAELEDHFEATRLFRVSQALIEYLIDKKLVLAKDIVQFNENLAALLNHSHFLASSFAGGDAEIVAQLNKDATATPSEELIEPGALETEREQNLQGDDDGASVLLFVPNDNDGDKICLEGNVLKIRTPQVVAKTLKRMKEEDVNLLSKDLKEELSLIMKERQRLASCIRQLHNQFPGVPDVFLSPRKSKCDCGDKESEVTLRKAFKTLTQTLNAMHRLQQCIKYALDRPGAQDAVGLKQLNERLKQARYRLQLEYRVSIISWFVFGLYGVAQAAPSATKVQRATCELAQVALDLPLVTPQILQGQAQKNNIAAYLAILFNLATLATRRGVWVLTKVQEGKDSVGTEENELIHQRRNLELIVNTIQLVNKLQNATLKAEDFRGCIIIDLEQLLPVLQTAQNIVEQKINAPKTPNLKLDGNPGLIPPPIPETVHVDCIPFELQFDDIFTEIDKVDEYKLIYGLTEQLKPEKQDKKQEKHKSIQESAQDEAKIQQADVTEEAPAPKKKGLLGRLFGF